MIITLTLNPSIDYIMQVPQIEVEDTLRADNAFFQAGGKGINVSRVLTRLHVPNRAWGFSGGDTGHWLRAFLDKEQVGHDFVPIRANTRINPIITESGTYRQIRISAPGGMVQPEEEDLLLDRFKQLSSREIQWIALGGSHPPGLTSYCTRRLIEQANRQGIRCILDADGEILKEGLQGKPYLIKPNQYELDRLLNQKTESVFEIVEGARSLIHQGLVEVVVTSRAKADALLITKDLVIVGKVPQVPVLSKVGAGDSMVAGLIKGLVEEASLKDMLRMGIAAGTAAVMTPGTELCRPEDYEKLLNQVAVEALTTF